MSKIAENLNTIRQTLANNTALVAVSKTYPAEAIMEAYRAGQRIFGENKVREMTEKQPLCPGDIEWHLIGHLQTNKVKYIAPFVSLIHSVDSLRLLSEIDKRAQQNQRIIDCLLQIHIAREESKFGMDEAEVRGLLTSDEYQAMRHIRIRGLMGMATFTSDRELIRTEFRSLRKLRDALKQDFFSGDESFSELSMGMSNDCDIAMEEGATLVRIGTAIFGAR